MPTVNEILTNFNGPNYHGRLHMLTPTDTPFLTALMGTAMGGGRVEQARTFEWQTVDLRDAGQNTVVDADRTGTGEHRSRQNVFNVLQTHREDVDISYERLAQINQFDGQNLGGTNPVTDEEARQIRWMLAQIKRDQEFSLINGEYTLPSDNNTAAKTRGILEAISTNEVDATDPDNDGIGVATSADSDDILDLDADHGLEVGDDFYFSDLTGGTDVDEDTRYFVISVESSSSLKFSATKGGSAVDFGSDITDGVLVPMADPDEEQIDEVMQSAYENGGLVESEMGLLMVDASLKRWLTKIYVKDKSLETRSRDVGGANVETVITPFGTLGVMLNRYMPSGVIATVSLDQCQPVHRFVPGRGITFVEDTAKDGASNASQLYSSIGLEYGNEAAHGKIVNLTANAPA